MKKEPEINDNNQTNKMSTNPKKKKNGIYIILAVIVLILLGLAIFLIYPWEDKQATVSEATATQIDTIAPPTQAAKATATPEVTLEATQTAQPTATPATTTMFIVEDVSVWVNVKSLTIRSEPDFAGDALGQIPYGQMISGKVCDVWKEAIYEQYKQGIDVSAEDAATCDKWLYISFDGIEGYIFCGKMRSGRNCVVYSESVLEPLG